MARWLLVRGGPVAALLGHLDDPLGLAVDLLQLLVAGPLAGQGHGGGLEDEAHLQQVPGAELGVEVLDGGEVHRGIRQLLGHEGAPAPLDLQDALGHQGGNGLPQGGAADAQLRRELILVGELLAGTVAPLVHDALEKALRRLLGELDLLG